MRLLDWKDLKDPVVLLATGFGVGMLPRMPGTWGSILALILWYFLIASEQLWLVLTVCSFTFALGWYVSYRITSREGLGDEPQIVIDEMVGMWVALAVLPRIWWMALIAFLLFRFLDILKPWPISWVDRHIKGGFGVMIDDVLAGLVTLIILRGVLTLFS